MTIYKCGKGSELRMTENKWSFFEGLSISRELILLVYFSLTLDNSWSMYHQQMYYHGEEIGVNVHIANSSSKTCKKIKVTSK